MRAGLPDVLKPDWHERVDFALRDSNRPVFGRFEHNCPRHGGRETVLFGRLQPFGATGVPATEAIHPVMLHQDPRYNSARDGYRLVTPREYRRPGFLDPMRFRETLTSIAHFGERNTKRTMPLRVILFLCSAAVALAQGNYEIQTYPSETEAPGTTMIELHSNFTIEGSKGTVDGVYGTEHQLHETVEITQGITDWFETGFYIFTSANPNQGGWQWVGDHIRPRARVPESWHWPVGVSLSLEFGYQRYVFSPDTWTLEIRPIIDKQIGRWYLAFNPVLDRSFHGPSVSQGVVFSPDFKAGYDITPKISAGLEYYGSLGPVGNFDPLYEQEQQIVPAVDLNVSPNWEFNFGVGVGVTRGTDHLLIKMILGRRLGKTKSGN